jgi:hypothetical protein
VTPSPKSDGDLAYLAEPGLDVLGLNLALTTVLGTDLVDLVDLATATGLLRYRATRDGLVLVERGADVLSAFRLEATLFWCDVEPVVRAAQGRVLSALR